VDSVQRWWRLQLFRQTFQLSIARLGLFHFTARHFSFPVPGIYRGQMAPGTRNELADPVFEPKVFWEHFVEESTCDIVESVRRCRWFDATGALFPLTLRRCARVLWLSCCLYFYVTFAGGRVVCSTTTETRWTWTKPKSTSRWPKAMTTLPSCSTSHAGST